MALVEVDAVDDPLDGLVQRGVVEHDVGGLASELQGEPLSRTRHHPADDLADLGGTGEGDLVDARVRDEGRAGLSGPRHDVDHAGRKVDLLDDLRQQQGGERRGLGRLEDGRVAAGESGGQLPRRHQQGEVPRDDLAGHAERTGNPAGKGVVELVRPSGVVEEVGRGQREVHVPRFLDRLPSVHRLEHGELARAVLERPGDPVQVLGPLPAGEVAPPLLPGLAGGLHRGVDVFLSGLGHLGQPLLRRRADRLEVPARPRFDEPAADEQPVARADGHDVLRLGRGGIFPRRSPPRLLIGRLLELIGHLSPP